MEEKKETPQDAAPWLHLLLEAAVVTASYAALAVFLLRPFFNHPANTVIDTFATKEGGWLTAPDVNLIMWVISWDWHALTTHPGALFNANIFHPAPAALASSEHMLGHLPIFGPVYALSGNLVLANQLNVLSMFALCGATMYALVRHWGAPRAAAAFAGFVYAFHPLRSFGLPHSHLLADEYLPLALLFLDRTLTEQRVRCALAFGLFLGLQALTSYYLAYMSAVALAGYVVGILWATRGRLRPRGVALVAGGGGAAVLVVGLLSLPYLRLRHLGVIADYTESWHLIMGATDLWRNYLYPPIAVREWGWRAWPGLNVYVGLLALGCALLALVPPWRRRWRISWTLPGLLGLTFACYVMALGPETRILGRSIPLPYALAVKWVPGFSSMRSPSRFGLVVMLGVAALAGLGLTRLIGWLRRRGAPRWAEAVLLVALVAGTTVEYGLRHFPPSVKPMAVGAQVPPVYRWLSQAEPGPVLEVPAGGLHSLSNMYRESRYMFFSTFHWHPLLNGYSGYKPPSYPAVIALARTLPDAHASEILGRIAGLRYVVVHLAEIPPEQRARWIQPPGLKWLASFGSDVVFELSGPPTGDLVSRFVDFTPASESVLGTPLAPVALSERRARLDIRGSGAIRATVQFPVEVSVTNLSQQTWPVLASVGPHLVSLAVRWQSEDGRILTEDLAAALLAYDLAPGQSVREEVHLTAPPAPGTAHLTIGLVQDGEWFPDVAGPFQVEVLPRPGR